MDKIIKSIRNSNAVLFLGAGFSRGAVNINNNELPLSHELANQIALIDGFDSEGDLAYASDRVLKNEDNLTKVINLLKENFTIKEVGDHHKIIAKVPWRRVYTTNYDTVFEDAATDIGKLIDYADSDSDLSEYQAKNNICVHLNGSIKYLNSDSINNRFKLSDSSYLNKKGFAESKWYRLFKQDLENADSIIFLGYSIYDIDIERVLHENAVYKDKVFFVNGHDVSDKDEFKLKKYGSILLKSVDEFANEIAPLLEQVLPSSKLPLLSLNKFELKYEEIDVRDSDVEDFLLRGNINTQMIEALYRNLNNNMLIGRSSLNQAFELLEKQENIAVISDFGNGKSVFLKMLAVKLAFKGANIYVSEYAEQRQLDELESLVREGQSGYLFIDAYDKNVELVQKFLDLKPSHIRLVLSARTHSHERLIRDELNQLEGFYEIEIDRLNHDEIDEFLNILNSTTFWGSKAGYQEHQKRKIISETNKAELASNLLDILSSPQIIDRVKNIIGNIFENDEFKDTVFSILLLSITDTPLTLANISEIAECDLVFKIVFKSDPNIKQLFYFDSNRVEVKSNAFALSLLNNHFKHEYVISKLLDIAGKLESSDVFLKDLQKSLFRFSIVERILHKNKRNNLVYYYEKLKQEVPWLRSNPHYWLQFGMAHLSLEDLDRAQGCFDQAYSYAENKSYHYHTNQIDTQQARLFIKKAILSTVTGDAFTCFEKAHNLLRSVPNDLYRYKQVDEYHSIYKKCFASFSKKQKVTFEQACKFMLAEIEALLSDQQAKKRIYIYNTQKSLQEVLNKITSER